MILWLAFAVVGCNSSKDAVVVSSDGNEVLVYCDAITSDMVLCTTRACGDRGWRVLRGSDSVRVAVLRCSAGDGGAQ